LSGSPTRFAPAAAILATEGLSYALVLPHLPVVVGESASWWAVGVLLAGYSVCQYLALGPISRAARRFGVPIVTSACLLGTSVGMVMTAVSTNYWILLGGRVIDGLSAGTVVLVTAAHLRMLSTGKWTKALGRLAAVRGASILTGIIVASAVGLRVSDPRTALQTTAWVGAVLPLIAIVFAARLGGARLGGAVDPQRMGPRTRRRMFRHIGAQSAQSALLVIAPALALVLATQTVSFLAPAAAIVGLGLGQLVLAPRTDQWEHWRTLGAFGLLIASFTALAAPLVGIAMFGVVVGASAPTAQSRLLQSRINEGSDDLEANALAGKSAIVGQIIGPITSFGALSISPTAAVVTVGALGGTALVRTRDH